MESIKANRKNLYFVIGCFILAIAIIGGTYAYFTASASDDTSVYGDSATVNFSLLVERITTVDMAFGLVPMRNNQAPAAVQHGCYDDYGNAGCQLYRITVSSDTNTVMFLDGFVSLAVKEGVQVRAAQVYTNDEEETFNTAFTPDDFVDVNTLSSSFLSNNSYSDLGIITGRKYDYSTSVFSREMDSGCYLFSNQQIGGDAGQTRVFYMMVWVYDNGEDQNYLQGMTLAYQGAVTFQTAEGNEITATFD